MFMIASLMASAADTLLPTMKSFTAKLTYAVGAKLMCLSPDLTTLAARAALPFMPEKTLHHP